MPTIGALDDPAPGLPPDAADQGRFAAAADVRLNATSAHGGLRIGVVVALVEAQMRRPTGPARGPHDDRIERGRDVPFVVDVGGGDVGGERDASGVGEDVTLYAALGAVRGVRTRVGPPFGAFTEAVSSEAQRHWIVRFRS